MKINDKNQRENKLNWIYFTGFFMILALPVLIWTPYFFPADWGKSIVFRSVAAIMLFLCLWQFLRKKEKFNWTAFKKNKIIWALGALFGIYFLASIFSVDPFFSFWGSPYRGGGFVTFAFFFIFALLAFILLKKEEWEKAWIFSIFIGVLVSIIGIFQYYGLFNKIFLSVAGRPPSTMGNPDLLALYLLLLFFITLSFAIKGEKTWSKIFYIFSLAIFFFTILITGSRAAYLGLATGIIYFLLLYPKKIKIIKIAAAGLLALAVISVLYVNLAGPYPKFLQQNKFFSSVAPRFMIAPLLKDSRFYAWAGIDYKILVKKPVLGYGPENFAVGFDKNYDPMVPNIASEGTWWDKAHNIIIQTGSDAGILGIIAYLALFIILFWQLRKTKTLAAHGVQATLIGYFVANLFGFDSFSTYLIFFLLIAYSLHLTAQNGAQNEIQAGKQKKALWRTIATVALFLALIIFLWQYNLIPLQINSQINTAESLANGKQCDKALGLMDKILPDPKNTPSFLDSYAVMEYVEFTKTCTGFYPENNLSYIKKDLELVKKAVKMQPTYTRYWIFLGNSMTALAKQEKNADVKNSLLKQADDYFNTAFNLAPKHLEILIGKSKMEMAAGDYAAAKNYSEECIKLNPALGNCYWYLALSEIYANNIPEADKNIQLANSKGYGTNTNTSLGEAADAYSYISDYKNLAVIFIKLTSGDPNVAQYHSSLAFFYAKLGEYDKAKQEALKVLQLSPESKPNVDAFLKTLPY